VPSPASVSPEELIIGTYTERLPHVDGQAEGILSCHYQAGTIGPPRVLARTRNPSFLVLSPDGRRLAYSELNPKTGADLWTIPLDLSDPDHPKPGKPEPFLQTSGQEFMAKFSPDGRWIAYYSDESGKNEVYVRPFPGPGGKWQISSGGGNLPIWSSTARQLFYQTLDAHIMVADYTAENGSFIPEKPRLWAERPIRNLGIINSDLAPDGKRFAVFTLPETNAEDKGAAHVTFLLNFFDELRRKVPVGK